MSNKLQVKTSAGRYVGRFAPTPSGPLHFGSIIAALASYLDARKHNGKWLLRFDDLDTPRIDTTAYDRIFYALEALRFEWDETPVYQRDNIDSYQSVLNKLSLSNKVYKCFCPRKLIKGIPYPGTCRSVTQDNRARHCLRVITRELSVEFPDLIQGDIQQNIAIESGDFIVLRSDGIIAYNLAAAIDDCHEITHVIRGADLLHTTPKQIYLQSTLGYQTPVYGHVPVALNAEGIKFSKQHGAEDVLLSLTPSALLVNALGFLGQPVDNDLTSAEPGMIIQWAVENWSIDRVPKMESIKVSREGKTRRQPV